MEIADYERITDFDMPDEVEPMDPRELIMIIARLKARALNMEPATRSTEAFCELVDMVLGDLCEVDEKPKVV